MQSTKVLNFKTPTEEDFSKINRLFKEYGGTDSCEGSAVTLFLWKDYYNEKFAVLEGTLYVSAEVEGELTFLIPFGGDIKKSVELLKDYTKKEGVKLSFFAPEGKRFDEFKRHFGQEFNIIESRDDFEYIYNSTDLINLSGKKYHSKRNHISAFSKAYNWSYENLNDQNLADVMKMADEWLAGAPLREDPSLISENATIKRILPRYKEYGIKGGLIRVDSKVVAFTFGSEINPKVFDVHIEKALWDFRTAYTLINREFVKNALSDYEFINREEDLGLEGLRKAKLSYLPQRLLKKYVMEEK